MTTAYDIMTDRLINLLRERSRDMTPIDVIGKELAVTVFDAISHDQVIRAAVAEIIAVPSDGPDRLFSELMQVAARCGIKHPDRPQRLAELRLVGKHERRVCSLLINIDDLGPVESSKRTHILFPGIPDTFVGYAVRHSGGESVMAVTGDTDAFRRMHAWAESNKRVVGFVGEIAP